MLQAALFDVVILTFTVPQLIEENVYVYDEPTNITFNSYNIAPNHVNISASIDILDDSLTEL